MAKDLMIRSSAEEFITFKVQEKDKGIQVRYENETLWITQKAMAELFDVEQPAIAKHLIKEKIIVARGKMLKHIDTTMTEVYWYVGKITYELSNNSTKASYGKQIIDALSSRLTNEFGSGFSPVSIRRMRKFYEIYPIWSAVPTELSWSHFQELIRVDRKEERGK